eukprot:758044-Hanusia_phi.AAC.1
MAVRLSSTLSSCQTENHPMIRRPPHCSGRPAAAPNWQPPTGLRVSRSLGASDRPWAGPLPARGSDHSDRPVPGSTHRPRYPAGHSP